MKTMVIVAMFCVGLVSTFGIDNNDGTAADNQPVITGGWHEVDTEELDEAIVSFFKDHLGEFILHPYAADDWIIERTWTQLVHGRRFLLAFYVMPMPRDDPVADVVPPILGLLMLRRDINGVITLEKEYNLFSLFNFIEGRIP